MKITKKIFFLKKSKRDSFNNKCRLKSGNQKSFEILMLKTSKNIHVQLIRVSDMQTVSGISTSSKDFIAKNNNVKSCNVNSSVMIGDLFAIKVKKMSINLDAIYFNRSQYRFHGKVKAFWDSFSSSMLLS